MSAAPNPESAFARMDRTAEYVWGGVRSHPAMRPIGAAGERIYVHCHTEAGGVGVGPDPHDANRHFYEARIDSPTWWDPDATEETFEGKGNRVAGRLAREIRKAWDSQEEEG